MEKATPTTKKQLEIIFQTNHSRAIISDPNCQLVHYRCTGWITSWSRSWSTTSWTSWTPSTSSVRTGGGEHSQGEPRGWYDRFLCSDISWKDLRGSRMRKISPTGWDGDIKRRWSRLRISSALNNPTESISTPFSSPSPFQWHNQVRNSFILPGNYFFI